MKAIRGLHIGKGGVNESLLADNIVYSWKTIKNPTRKHLVIKYFSEYYQETELIGKNQQPSEYKYYTEKEIWEIVPFTITIKKSWDNSTQKVKEIVK